MSLIEITNLGYDLGAKKILHDIDLKLFKGEIVTVVGPNGSGKSTLLRLIIGAITPTKGSIERKRNLRIGYVPQSLHIDPTIPITVRRFLNLPIRVPINDLTEATKQAGINNLFDKQMTELSGGQFQRVLLARALINKPDILLLDEPTQGLDQPGSANFYQQIEQLRKTLNCSVLMVSHELHVVMSASDRVICLNGHICCQGKPEIVASAPEYKEIFGSGTEGALAIYRHEHNHSHGSDNLKENNVG